MGGYDGPKAIVAAMPSWRVGVAESRTSWCQSRAGAGFMSDWGTYVGIEKFQNWKRKKCHIVLFFVTVVCDKVIDQKVIVIWAAWAMTLVTWQNNFKNREWMWRHCKSEFQFRNLILKLFPQKCGRSNRSPGLSWSGREPFVRELLIRGCWSRVMGPYPTR